MEAEKHHVNHENNLPENIIEAIKQIAIENGYESELIKINIENKLNTELNFVASIFRITINGVRHQNNNILKDKLVLICKIPQTNHDSDTNISTMLLFQREVFVYNELLPNFQKFQIDKGIKEDEGFFSFPKCYKAYYNDQKNDGFIIMEDSEKTGFTKINKYKTATYEEVKPIMIALGRLHAVSFAMKEQQPDMFEMFKLNDNTNKKTEHMDMLLDTVFTEAKNTLRNQEQYLKKQIDSLKTNYWKLMDFCKNSGEAEPYAVLTHGDCWTNNILYTEQQNSSHGDIRFINWQFSRYCSPVLDLLYCIFISTNRDTRFDHYNNFIHIYYESLATHLKRLGGDPSRQFPISALQHQLKLYGKFGLGSAIFVITMHCNPNNLNLSNIDRDSNSESEQLEGENNNKYDERMSSIIRDAFNLGYF